MKDGINPCDKCGNPLADDAWTCPNCGTSGKAKDNYTHDFTFTIPLALLAADLLLNDARVTNAFLSLF